MQIYVLFYSKQELQNYFIISNFDSRIEKNYTMHKGNNPINDILQSINLLRQEFEYEKNLYEQQNRSALTPNESGKENYWYPVQLGGSYFNSLNQYIIEVDSIDIRETEHEFETGKPVRFFIKDKNGYPKYFNFSATVSYAEEKRLYISIPSPSFRSTIENFEIGIQIYFDETSYKCMFDAMEQVAQAKDTRLAEMRNILLGNTPARFGEGYPIRFPWLNKSQELAVNHIINAKDVAIVHGPPGTGKTTTLVESIYETLHRESQVLVCAQSNIATDFLCEKLIDRGVSVLRIGNPARVNDKVFAHTYEKKYESHPDYSELWNIRKSVREIIKNIRNRSEGKDNIKEKLNKLKSRATEIEIKIEQDLFSEARVIASTLISAGNRVLNHKKFTTVFIDEAAQALEGACWVPILKSERVIFAGDHYQLPPTIKCIGADRAGLSVTLMQKLMLNKSNISTMLTMQYRMHQDIMEFSSRVFYDCKLTAAPEVRYRTILSWDTPLVWIDTKETFFEDSFFQKGKSRINKHEARLLVERLILYIKNIGVKRIIADQIDFGIISPYKAQTFYLRHLINQNSFLRPLKKRISVNTVDGFQGQERDVIFISLVRATTTRNIGFLSDIRRMNVAITRARMKLFILGNSETLSQNKFYKYLYEYIGDRGEIIKINNQDEPQ